MEKIKNKSNIFLKIAGGAITITAIIFLFSLFAIATSNAPSKKIANEPLLNDNVMRIYVVSGKIVNVQNDTISAETPVFDSKKNKWDETRKEIRNLTIDNTTILKRITSRPRAGKKNELEYISNDIKLSDFKNGDSVNIKHSKDVSRIKDFTPEAITILSY